MGLGEKVELCVFVKDSLFAPYLGPQSRAPGSSSLNFPPQLQF